MWNVVGPGSCWWQIKIELWCQYKKACNCEHRQICTHIDENHLDLLPEHIKTQTIKLKKPHVITPINLIVDTEHRPTTTMQSVGATDSNKHRSTQLLNEKRNLWKCLQTWRNTSETEVSQSKFKSPFQIRHRAPTDLHMPLECNRPTYNSQIHITQIEMPPKFQMQHKCLQTWQATTAPHRSPQICQGRMVGKVDEIPGGCWGLIKKVALLQIARDRNRNCKSRRDAYHIHIS